MNTQRKIGALLLASAVAGLLGQSSSAHACTGFEQTTFGLDSSCVDGNTSGRSRGIFGPKRLEAYLFQGKRARAAGLKTNGDISCSVFDLFADGENPATSSPCTTTTIKHKVIVEPKP